MAKLDKGGQKNPLTEKVYIAKQDFRDKDNYDKVYKKGTIVEGFSFDRIQKALENELVTEEKREV